MSNSPIRTATCGCCRNFRQQPENQGKASTNLLASIMNHRRNETGGTQAMRLHHAAFVALLIAPVLVTAQGNLGTYEDRIAVEDVMARYVWAVDSLDPEGYVAVFTEDAIIDSNGSVSKGREEIRKIVTSLIQRREDNKAKGLP